MPWCIMLAGFTTNRLNRSKKGLGNLIIAFGTCVLFSSPCSWAERIPELSFYSEFRTGWGAAQHPTVWRSEKATLPCLLHIAPAQHVLDSATSRFLSLYELNLDFLSAQQERAAPLILGLHHFTLWTGNPQRYAKIIHWLSFFIIIFLVMASKS